MPFASHFPLQAAYKQTPLPTQKSSCLHRGRDVSEPLLGQHSVPSLTDQWLKPVQLFSCLGPEAPNKIKGKVMPELNEEPICKMLQQH